MSAKKQKTYRVRQIPYYVRESELPRLLHQILDRHGATDNIRVFSLAKSVDSFERPPAQVATITFKSTPARLQETRNEWIISKDETRLPHNLIVDTHFLGFTTLNNVDSGQHEIDCFAISGLASHPFGSWKVRDDDSTFMWLRDRLPDTDSGVRCILYGYDTHLANSTSFKNIEDIARNLMVQLKFIGCTSYPAKSTIFIAHSLGGVVLKEMFVQTARGDEGEVYLLSNVKKILLFGVPNQGMRISHLVPMVRGQPNEALVDQLSSKSEYLRLLDQQFSGVSFHRAMRVISIYETGLSRITQEVEPGIWTLSGPLEILVDKRSAIHSHSKRQDIFSVDSNHSNLVKFSENDPALHVVLGYIHTGHDKLSMSEKMYTQTSTTSVVNVPESLEAFVTGDQVKILRDSIFLEETFQRFHAVEVAHRDTFDWVFDADKTSLIEWLRDASPAYWINGKPGSGKSTVMKYIFDRKDDFRHVSGALQIDAHFFFSRRGTPMQKSLNGLLRCVLHQILAASRKMTERLLLPKLKTLPVNWSEDPTYKLEWTTEELENIFFNILKQRDTEVEITLFLDALDEFDGDPRKTTSFVRECIAKANGSTTKLKICVASRPWNAFRDSFAHMPHFRVEDHTSADMAQYVQARFYDDEEISRLLRSSQGPVRSPNEAVPEQLLSRADGVFLWLRLVLDIIIKGLAEGASPWSLSAIIDDMPTELEELYNSILKRIEPKYLKESYIILEIVLRSEKPLTPLQVWNAEQCYLLGPDQTGLYSAELTNEKEDPFQNQDLMRRHIQSRCGGLVDIILGNYPSASYEDAKKVFTVQLMHQTAREFLLVPTVWQGLMQDNTLKTRNGHSILAQYYFNRCLLSINANESVRHAGGLSIDHTEYLFQALEAFRSHTREAERSTGTSQEMLLESVEDRHYICLNRQLHDDGVVVFMGFYDSLSFGVFIDLSIYVRNKIRKTGPSSSILGSLLHFAVRNLYMQDTAILQSLLESGADIQTTHDGKTPFQAFCSRLMRMATISFKMEDDIRMARRFDLFLSYGQDPNEAILFELDKVYKFRSLTIVMKALHMTSNLGMCRATETLLKHKADVNGLDGNGRTPLGALKEAAPLPKYVTKESRERCERLLESHGGLVLVQGPERRRQIALRLKALPRETMYRFLRRWMAPPNAERPYSHLIKTSTPNKATAQSKRSKLS